MANFNRKLMVRLGQRIVGAGEPLSALFANRGDKCSSRVSMDGHGCQKEPGPMGLVVSTREGPFYARLCRACERPVREVRNDLRVWAEDDAADPETARKILVLLRLFDKAGADKRITQIEQRRAVARKRRQERDAEFAKICTIFANEEKTREALDPRRAGCSLEHPNCGKEAYRFFAAALPRRGFWVIRLCRVANAAFWQSRNRNPEGQERLRSYLGRAYPSYEEAGRKVHELNLRFRKSQTDRYSGFENGNGNGGDREEDRAQNPPPKPDRRERKAKGNKWTAGEGRPEGKPVEKERGGARRIQLDPDEDEALRESRGEAEPAVEPEARVAYRDPKDKGNRPFAVAGLAAKLTAVAAKGA